MLRVADDYFADTDTGRHRRANEDSFFARSPVFAVADGMGGAQAGEVASRTAIDVLARARVDGAAMERVLGAVLQEANARVHELSVRDDALAGMGTTMTVAHVGPDEVTVAHVGDSRCYRWRDGVLERLTDDHSLVDEYVRQGRLTQEEAEHHPQRSIITRAIGPEGRVEVDAMTLSGRDGDVFLLCSDGLTTMIGEAEVADVLTSASTLRHAGRELIARANRAGGKDNITVVLFRLEEVPGPGAGDEQDTTESRALPAVEPRAGGPVATAPATGRAETTVAPRAPRVPTASPAAPASAAGAPPRRRRSIAGPVLVLVVLATVLIGGFYATQTVYFVGASPSGHVAVFRGVPYELPAGLDLYTPVYESGVPATEARGIVEAHELRSRDDAYALVRALERGEVEPS